MTDNSIGIWFSPDYAEEQLPGGELRSDPEGILARHEREKAAVGKGIPKMTDNTALAALLRAMAPDCSPGPEVAALARGDRVELCQEEFDNIIAWHESEKAAAVAAALKQAAKICSDEGTRLGGWFEDACQNCEDEILELISPESATALATMLAEARAEAFEAGGLHSMQTGVRHALAEARNAALEEAKRWLIDRAGMFHTSVLAEEMIRALKSGGKVAG